ncbi:hypothetical protein RR46_06998 [Papilio xuthus]|uniref:Uncharacterized protein n=1 Tax=Papilio xuthus TaxID=66420 RepID=A0A194Q4E2_PAPXU|nr:hypothetical protein RR46_06998 [Papilio xuthus]
MSQQFELLTESPGQWTSASYVIPEIQKKEIKPFVVLSLKELEGNPDSRTSSLTNSNKYSAVREVVRHVARSRSATKEPWCATDVRNFLENLNQNNIEAENANPERCKEITQRDTHIILILKLTDGQTKTYRLSIAKFHELRYVIASALKSMIVLEKRKCMRQD